MTETKKSPLQILFVDDEEKARKYFAKGFEKEFNILTASSVDEAQKIVDEKHDQIAVVITDQRMPGGNGVKLLQYLRENYPKIIRLLTTAYSDVTDAIDSVNKGEILRYIQKPWDFDMLKHELIQALDLFLIKMERDQLLYEKLMVKRKMTKLDRVRQLILLSKTLNYIRFSNKAVEAFIKQFANSQNNQQKDWKDFELGNEDLLETMFLLEIVEGLNNKIPFNKNYDFENSISSAQIISLIEETSKEFGIAVNKKSIADSNIQINNYSFNTAFTQLLSYTKNLSKEIEVEIAKTNNGIAINIVAKNITSQNNSNLFFASPTNKQAVENYVNLLAFYLLIGHHAGAVLVKTNDGNTQYSIELPENPKNITNLQSFSEEDLDDMLVSVIINDA